MNRHVILILLRSASLLTCMLSLSLLSYGIFLRSKFHHGHECDMTYSHLQFIPIAIDNVKESNQEIPSRCSSNEKTRDCNNYSTTNLSDKKHSKYKFWKFTDGRDVRYAHLRSIKGSTLKMDNGKGNEWCHPKVGNGIGNNDDQITMKHAVLFVPGHEGQYMQARSLGAHGIQLSRRHITSSHLQHIRSGLVSVSHSPGKNHAIIHDLATELDDFMFDVYAVDFGEERSALHGSRLYAQSEYVMEVLDTLEARCGLEHVTIVGHSVGGIVSRMALVLKKKRLRAGRIGVRSDGSTINSQVPVLKVRNLITLGTPHQYLPYIFDHTVYWFYKLLFLEERKQKNKSNDYADDEEDWTTVLSISGGLRDELIPPLHTTSPFDSEDNYNHNDVTLSYLASDMVPPRQEFQSAKEIEMATRTLHYGMDHRAIVWCHNNLSVVREVIHNQINATVNKVMTRKEREERLSQLLKDKIRLNLGGNGAWEVQEKSQNHNSNDKDNSDTDWINMLNGNEFTFPQRVALQDKQLENEYGFWGALAIQSAMIYNLSLPLVVLYVLTVILDLIYVLATFFALRKHHCESRSDQYEKIGMKIRNTIFYLFAPILTGSTLYFVGRQSRGVISHFSLESRTLARCFLLAYTAMNLYFFILNGLLPIAAHLTNYLSARCFPSKNQKPSTENGESESNLSSSSYDQIDWNGKFRSFSMKKYEILKQQLSWFVFLSFLHTATVIKLHKKHILFKTKEYVGPSTTEEDERLSEFHLECHRLCIGAHSFFIFVELIFVNIFFLGVTLSRKSTVVSIVNKSETFSKNITCEGGRKLIALLLPIFPLLTVGKVVYAWSLLSVGGQHAAMLYMQYERGLWVSSNGIRNHNDNSYDLYARLYGWIATLLDHDLERFQVTICIPIYLLLIWLQMKKIQCDRTLCKKQV